MPTIKVTIGEETHEVDFSAIELPESFELISPDNASSKGYFTQAQLDQKIENRLKREPDKIESKLLESEDFHKKVLNKYNVQLDENGQPKGLKPEFDPEEWKAKKAKELTKPLEEKLEKESDRSSTYKNKLIEQSILSATKGAWKEEYTKYQDEGRVKPIAVNQFKELFDIDDNGEIALKDTDGFRVNAKGQHISPDEYLTDKDRFGDFMMDTRQKGSDFRGGGEGNGQPTFKGEDVKNMPDEEYEKHRKEIFKAAADGRVD